MPSHTGPIAALLAVAFLGWTYVERDGARLLEWYAVLAVVAALALVGALVAAHRGRDGWAFAGTAATIALAVAALFVSLFPEVLPSSLDPAWSLTTTNAAATDYTLTIMTWVAVLFTPIVLLYQGWSYHVFRRRIGVANIPDDEPAPEPHRPTRPAAARS